MTMFNNINYTPCSRVETPRSWVSETPWNQAVELDVGAVRVNTKDDRDVGHGGGRFGFKTIGRAWTGDCVQILNYVLPHPNKVGTCLVQ